MPAGEQVKFLRQEVISSLQFVWESYVPSWSLDLKLTPAKSASRIAKVVDLLALTTVIDRQGQARYEARIALQNRSEQFLRVRLPAELEALVRRRRRRAGQARGGLRRPQRRGAHPAGQDIRRRAALRRETLPGRARRHSLGRPHPHRPARHRTGRHRRAANHLVAPPAGRLQLPDPRGRRKHVAHCRAGRENGHRDRRLHRPAQALRREQRRNVLRPGYPQLADDER